MSAPPAETLISLVVPLEGDAGDVVEAFVAEVVPILNQLVTHYEIILVDDGIDEASVLAVQALLERCDFIRFLRLSRHFGEETAIAAGLDIAIGDYVIVMLPSMDPPALIAQFLELARADADIVYGVRLHRRSEPGWYRFGARLFYWYINSVVKAGIPENSTQFRCMSRQVVNAITKIRDPDRYLRLLTSYVGFRKQPLPYAPINRTGQPFVRPRGEAFALARALVMDHTAHPLRLVSWGAVVGALAIVAGAAVHTARRGDGGALLGSAQFLVVTVVLAVIAEYVAGLSRRLRDRPAYYVREERTSSVLLREDRVNVVSEGSDVEWAASIAAPREP